jgi:hypothetical protein
MPGVRLSSLCTGLLLGTVCSKGGVSILTLSLLYRARRLLFILPHPGGCRDVHDSLPLTVSGMDRNVSNMYV